MKQDKMEHLLEMTASRLGVTPEQLKQGAANGNLAELLNGMAPEDAQSIQRVLQDQQAAKKLLDSPQARELLRRLHLQ